MKDLKHLIYFESLLENADNDLVKQAQAEGKAAYALPLLQQAGLFGGSEQNG